MLLQGSLSIERMCQLVPVSRRGFYRSLKEQQPADEELEARSAIQQIALEHRRRYGYRRITAELHRRGMQINHKRVVRIMREDNLLGLQPKRFKVTRTRISCSSFFQLHHTRNRTGQPAPIVRFSFKLSPPQPGQ
jgi:putative transposase